MVLDYAGQSFDGCRHEHAPRGAFPLDISGIIRRLSRHSDPSVSSILVHCCFDFVASRLEDLGLASAVDTFSDTKVR